MPPWDTGIDDVNDDDDDDCIMPDEDKHIMLIYANQ